MVFAEAYMKRKIDHLRFISLLVVGIAALILNGSDVVGIDLPVWLTGSLGIVDLAAVFVLIFCTVRKNIKKQ